MNKTLQTGFENYLIPAGYFLLFAGLYYSSLQWLVLIDWNWEDFNYAYMIPAVVLYLIWEKRAILSHTPSQPSWLGMAPVLAGLLLFWLGELAGDFFSIYVFLWLMVVDADTDGAYQPTSTGRHKRANTKILRYMSISPLSLLLVCEIRILEPGQAATDPHKKSPNRRKTADSGFLILDKRVSKVPPVNFGRCLPRHSNACLSPKSMIYF